MQQIKQPMMSSFSNIENFALGLFLIIVALFCQIYSIKVFLICLSNSIFQWILNSSASSFILAIVLGNSTLLGSISRYCGLMLRFLGSQPRFILCFRVLLLLMMSGITRFWQMSLHSCNSLSILCAVSYCRQQKVETFFPSSIDSACLKQQWLRLVIRASCFRYSSANSCIFVNSCAFIRIDQIVFKEKKITFLRHYFNISFYTSAKGLYFNVSAKQWERDSLSCMRCLNFGSSQSKNLIIILSIPNLSNSYICYTSSWVQLVRDQRLVLFQSLGEIYTVNYSRKTRSRGCSTFETRTVKLWALRLCYGFLTGDPQEVVLVVLYMKLQQLKLKGKTNGSNFKNQTSNRMIAHESENNAQARETFNQINLRSANNHYNICYLHYIRFIYLSSAHFRTYFVSQMKTSYRTIYTFAVQQIPILFPSLDFLYLTNHMYLSSFYKLKFEKYITNGRVYGTFALPATLWFIWLFYPSLYNTVYTDFIPPPKGVQRRKIESQDDL